MKLMLSHQIYKVLGFCHIFIENKEKEKIQRTFCLTLSQQDALAATPGTGRRLYNSRDGRRSHLLRTSLASMTCYPSSSFCQCDKFPNSQRGSVCFYVAATTCSQPSSCQELNKRSHHFKPALYPSHIRTPHSLIKLMFIHGSYPPTKTPPLSHRPQTSVVKKDRGLDVLTHALIPTSTRQRSGKITEGQPSLHRKFQTSQAQTTTATIRGGAIALRLRMNTALAEKPNLVPQNPKQSHQCSSSRGSKAIF